jgi:hypothetical protein
LAIVDAHFHVFAQARKTKNLLDKDVLSKRAVGVPEEVMHRTAELLRI